MQGRQFIQHIALIIAARMQVVMNQHDIQLLNQHKNKGFLSMTTICSTTKEPFMPNYLPKYLSKSPLNALPCLASSLHISCTVS
jgi:hypothetical protein